MESLETTLGRLAEVSRLLDTATLDLADADLDAVQAKVRYVKAYARSFLVTQGSMDIRRYTADADTIDELEKREISEAQCRAGKERLRTLRDQMEILRTTAAGQRVQFMAEPTGQWT